MRLDRDGQLRSRSNAGGMEQKDHILRLARGVSCKGGSLADFIRLLAAYVDADDDTILDQYPYIGVWMMGGAEDQPEN